MKVKLKDVCLQFLVPMRDKPKVFGGNIPWCRIEDIEGRFFNKSLAGLCVSEETVKKMNLTVFPIGTVICSCSATLGVYAINTVPLVTNQTFIGLVCDENKIYNKYLYYLMKLMTKKLSYMSIGSTIAYVPRETFEELEIELPELKLQHKVADILWELDSKIENNASINSELESIAKTLYDYWFLQFEFPNEEGKPYKSSGGKMVYNEELKREIPEGWENTSVDEMIEKAPSLKAIKAPDYLNAGKYPIVDQADTLITGYTNDESFLFDNKDGCVVFGDVTTYFKYINFPFAKGTDGTKIMIAKNNRIPPLLLFHTLRHAELPNIGFARHYMLLRDYKFVVPSKTICNKYDQFTKPMMNRRASLIKENQELASLRDFLLPMLMNGQVTFK